MQTYFLDKNSKNLILLFNGWGMDERPFLPLESSFDIIFISDYTNLNDDFLDKYNFSKYENIYLIAFSAGVLMSSLLKDKLPKIKQKIAINGVPKLFDNNCGITDTMLNEMQNITLENALEFRKKLIDDENHLEKFNQNQPLRDLDSSMKELERLQEYAKNSIPLDFDKIIISKHDEIIPKQNQLNFWINHKNIKTTKGGHFPFYNVASFDEIINY